VDNESIVAGAADVLRRQPVLPQNAGEDLATAVRRWLPRQPQILTGWDLRADLVWAALATQSEPARKVVLEMLQNPPGSRDRRIGIAALAESSGDDDWLRRARAAIVAVTSEKFICGLRKSVITSRSPSLDR
jgi:hypothetical protein